MLQRHLEQISKTEEFQQGTLNLNDYRFNDINEIESLISWISGHSHLDKLCLANCSIGVRTSVRIIFSEQAVAGTPYAPLPITNPSFSSLLKTKATVISSLIQKRQWREINLNNNNLSQNESEIIIQAITSTQKALRRLEFGINPLSEISAKRLGKYLSNKNKCILKYLYLPSTFKSQSSKWFALILEGLKKNETLREIDVSNNRLTDSSLEQLINLLPDNVNDQAGSESPYRNTTLTRFEQSSDNLSAKLVSQLHERLEFNEIRRENLHQQLLSKENMLLHAVSAIRNDYSAWLEILIGVDKKEKEEEFIFNKTQFEIFLKLRSVWFACGLVTHQFDFIQTINQGDLTDKEQLRTIQYQVEQISIRAIEVEISIIEENLSRVSLDIVDDELVELTIERKIEIVEQFKKEIIVPAIKKYPLIIEEDSILSNLEKALSKSKQCLEKEVGVAQKKHHKLQEAHFNYEYIRNQLLTSFKIHNPYLIPCFQAEFEEIAPKIVEVHVDPNSIVDEEGNTLLHFCFKQNMPNCLKLLLSHGADILLKNNLNQSVFSELFTGNNATPCHQVLLTHIQIRVAKIWFNLEEHPEIEGCKNIKKVLDNYISILIKNSRMPKIIQLFTGVSKCLNSRKTETEMYYNFLQEAAQIIAKHPLRDVLLEMLELTQTAKRGWFAHSKLHDNLKDELIASLKKISYQEIGDKLNQIAKEFDNLLIKSSHQEKELDFEHSEEIILLRREIDPREKEGFIVHLVEEDDFVIVSNEVAEKGEESYENFQKKPNRITEFFKRISSPTLRRNTRDINGDEHYSKSV
jgi:hypothetical protein